MRMEFDDEYYESLAVLDAVLQKDTTLGDLWSGRRTTIDTGLWDRVSRTGLGAVAVPAELGGAGLSYAHAVPVCTLLARSAVPHPIVETIMVALPLLCENVERPGVRAAVDDIVSGASLATVAPTPGAPAPWAEGVTWRLVAGPDGVEVHHRDASTVESLPGQDLALGLGRVTGGRATASLPAGRSRHRHLLAASAQLVGLADRCIAMAVEHAKAREQFGRPIGSFQAIKHMLAEAYTDVEVVRRFLPYAADLLERDSPQAATAVTQAKALTGDAATRAGDVALQVHGAIGYTWEHPLQATLKRIAVLDGLLGTSHHHWAELGANAEAERFAALGLG